MQRTPRPTLAVLCGGLGGARLAMAAIESGTSAGTTFITNVADDWCVGGLHICPDTDAVLYALSNRFDEDRGWGIRDDRFPGPRPSEPSWFGIGELDRATHVQRGALLDAGTSLSASIRSMAHSLGIDARVVPVTDDPVRTRVRVGTEWNAFQEWMVRDRGPRADEVRCDGLARAQPAAGVIQALVESTLVVIASSSPVASIAPILGVSGVRDALERRRGPTLALSPVVLARPLLTDRDRHRDTARRRLLAAAGVEHTPGAVAAWMAPLVSHFALDPSDAGWSDDVAATGATPVLAPVIGIDRAERASLIRLFHAASEWDRSSVRTMEPTS